MIWWREQDIWFCEIKFWRAFSRSPFNFQFSVKKIFVNYEYFGGSMHWIGYVLANRLHTQLMCFSTIPNCAHFQKRNCFKNVTKPKTSALYVVLLIWPPIFGNILFFKKQILILDLKISSRFILIPLAIFDAFLTNLSSRTFLKTVVKFEYGTWKSNP